MTKYKWAFAALLVFAGLTTGDVWGLDSHANRLSFSAPVGLPGVGLGSGTYIFDHPSGDLDIVRVTSLDGRIVYYTGFTRAVQRPRGLSRDVAVTFAESARGTPAPIKEWFPVGQSRGHQFIYPK